MDNPMLLGLPHLCMEMIFDFLELQDLLRCRLVCRQFKTYAEGTRVRELVVNWSTLRNWYQTDRLINCNNSISITAFPSVRSSPLRLDQLRFLCIYMDGPANAALHIENVNQFQALVHLEVKFDRRCKHSVTLRLPNLRLLNVRSFRPQPSYILATPNLDVLACNLIDEVEHPRAAQVRQLKCDYISDNRLAGFTGLERLKLRCKGQNLSGLSLSNWTVLKELSITYSDSNLRDEFKDSLTTLMRQRTNLKRKELRIYLNDVLLNDLQQLDLANGENPRAMKNSERFMFKNYRQIRSGIYPSIISVHFNELMVVLDFKLADDFFDRFKIIGFVTAAGRIDRDLFKSFLRHARQILSLTLINTDLSLEFMNLLPEIRPGLTNLCINGYSGPVNDFEFILRFNRLETFVTDAGLFSFEFIIRTLQKLNNLRCIRFRADDCTVQIDGLKSYNLQIFEGYFAGNDFFRRTDLNLDGLLAAYREGITSSLPKRPVRKRARLE